MAKAVKLADIAERVGVSTVTVSKALSGQKGVSEEVREKIRSIAEELGYQQPSAARKSQNQKSYNIGILISERFLDKYESFYWQMYQAVATRATAKECFTMLEVIGMPEEENGRMPKLVQERKVDGIIVILLIQGHPETSDVLHRPARKFLPRSVRRSQTPHCRFLLHIL